MHEVGHLDVALYLVLVAVAIGRTHGVLQLLQIVFTTAAPCLLWQWPWAVFSRRVFLRVPLWTAVETRTSDFEFSTVYLLRLVFGRLAPESRLMMLRSNWALEWTTRLRLFFRRGGFEEIDIHHTAIKGDLPFEQVEGLWVYSNLAFMEHGPSYDTILYYIPGGAFMVGSPYLYLEMVRVLMLGMLEQGFANPAVFIPQVPLLPGLAYPAQLLAVVRGWGYLSANYPKSLLVVAGDSTGGTLALALMLHVARPSPVVEEFQRVERVLDGGTELSLGGWENTPEPHLLRKPAAAMLISPVVLFSPSVSCPADWVTPEVIARWGEEYSKGSDTKEDRYLDPGSCDDAEHWREAFPEQGVVCTYGDHEVLAPEIAAFFLDVLLRAGPSKALVVPNSVHAGPVVTFYTERTVEDREFHVEVLACVLARMVLWQSRLYRLLDETIVYAAVE